MKKKNIYTLFIFTLCIFITSCNNHTTPPTPSKPQILVSLPPYEHLIKKIVGDDYCVQTVVPVGSDPHSYEPSAKQTSQIANAVLWFKIGESFEKKLLSAIQQKKPESARHRFETSNSSFKKSWMLHSSRQY